MGSCERGNGTSGWSISPPEGLYPHRTTQTRSQAWVASVWNVTGFLIHVPGALRSLELILFPFLDDNTM
jgi:hypothetical protein